MEAIREKFKVERRIIEGRHGMRQITTRSKHEDGNSSAVYYRRQEEKQERESEATVQTPERYSARIRDKSERYKSGVGRCAREPRQLGGKENVRLAERRQTRRGKRRNPPLVPLSRCRGTFQSYCPRALSLSRSLSFSLPLSSSPSLFLPVSRLRLVVPMCW